MLSRLRPTLDLLPSPIPERPGLVMRDPFHFSDATLIIPPALVPCLEFFDGEHSVMDLREFLVQLTGDLDVSALIQHLEETLSTAGFLEDESFTTLREGAEKKFAEAPLREPVHAGSGYPDDAGELKEIFTGYMNGTSSHTDVREGNARRVLAIAAPHVSPFGGVDAYRAAYSSLSPEDGERTFVILGTSHYGHPDRIGLTRKPFATPLGETITDIDFVNRLAASAGDGALMEDYCHAIEHSIEFQVVFLQHLFGPRIRVVPILCGPYARSLFQGGMPEDDERVRRTLGALGELAARESERLLWVLGVDMAHMGRRYGDPITVRASDGHMTDVARRDRLRIECMERGDARGFWNLVQENRDDLKWCGSAPIYTFLKAVPQAVGSLLHYQQWNIDDASVVSFAGVRFYGT